MMKKANDATRMRNTVTAGADRSRFVRPKPALQGGLRLMKLVLTWMIQFYRKWISPLKPPTCRFYPSCSQYALEAIETHGVGKGAWLSVKRICKCHPFHPGGIDPVPPRKGSRGWQAGRRRFGLRSESRAIPTWHRTESFGIIFINWKGMNVPVNGWVHGRSRRHREPGQVKAGAAEPWNMVREDSLSSGLP